MPVSTPTLYERRSLVNLNKLFGRLPIRRKLGIAFAVLALGPVALVAALATQVTVAHLYQIAQRALEHDLETVRRQTERAVSRAEQDVTYLSEAALGAFLRTPGAAAAGEPARLAAAFLAHDSVLFQTKVIALDGTVLATVRADGARARSGSGEAPEGILYALHAASLAPGEHLLLPVELRPPVPGSSPLPAVAILVPVRDTAGKPLGTVVGEAYASVLFAGLEEGSPQLRGVTGLVNPEGLFLYHSERKRNWGSLLAPHAEVALQDDFLSAEVADIVSGRTQTTPVSDDRIVSFRPLRLGSSAIGPLTVYRVVPTTAFDAPVRRFLGWAGAAGGAVFLVVLGLAATAARQFTQPIYRLREAVAQLAQGGAGSSLAIETNDELEDLAADFAAMAHSLSRYRNELEQLVTERTRALRETHAELADILANSADAIIGLDSERRVRVWNRGAEQLLGYPQSEVLGRDLDTFLLPRGPAAERELAFIHRELARHGAVVNHQTKRLAKDGRLIPVSLTLTSLQDETGRPLGSSVILRDTSAQARLEEQMRRSERIAAVSVMAAGLAHEINNPLAIIANRVECMEREVVRRCPGCFLDGDLSVLHEHTARLSVLTRDLLRLARDDDLGPAPVLLADVGRRVAGLLEHTFAARGLQLEVEAGEAIPPLIGSEGALETVCMNLLLNAADATPAGGSVGLAIRAGPSGDAVELEVWDTGPGVPPELRQRIFEPFFTTKGAAKGTGLGLAVCRNVVERHHGEIWVEDRPGGGSRFIVSLPLSAEAASWRQPAYS